MQKFEFNSDFLEKLKYNNDLVSVVSKYVPLKESGNTFWGCCPFHHEKTPSFAVNSVEQYYHCFGCGKSGDVITFVREMESLDFIEAVKLLANNAHMDMPEHLFDENLIKKKKEKESVLNALRLANEHYKNNLSGCENAVNYIKKRGLSPEIVEKFELGYSKDFSSLVKFLFDKKIPISVSKQAGLVNEKNGHFYDPMFERLTFPIKNSFGDVIGFSSRVLVDKPESAKYKNSPQTIVFDKSKVVFGVQFLKELKNAGKLNEIIIVEGQMDVISMHNAGFSNAVATMGTALTQLHAKELKRFCDKIILCFDGDSAGKKATLKAIDVLKNEDLDIYCVTLPENLDPDEYVKKYGTEKMKEQIASSKDCYEYRINVLKDGYNLSDKLELSKFITQSLKIVSEIKLNSEREIYLKLIKNIAGISLDVLKQDLMNLEMPIKNQEKKEKFVPAILTDNVYKSQVFILASLIHKKPYAYFVEINNFNVLAFQNVYEYIKSCNESGKEIIIGALFDTIDSEDKELAEILNYKFQDDVVDKKYFDDCVKVLKLDDLTKRQTMLMNKLAETASVEERKILAKQMQNLTKEINLLKTEERN
ncbi:MAG: DNA primase [Christensenellales bacterium]